MTFPDLNVLQRLAGLQLSPAQEAKILPQMSSIIGFLGQLDTIVLDTSVEETVQDAMPLASGISIFGDTKNLLTNVHHTKTGNAISIKGFVDK